MKRQNSSMVFSAIVCCLGAMGGYAGDSFDGTWCVEEQDLSITFQGNDSLKVKSVGDEGVSGVGSFAVDDSLLRAKIVNGDLSVEMGYRYKWDSDEKVSARLSFFIVNGDSVEHPTEWMSMVRCSGTKDLETGDVLRAEVEENEKSGKKDKPEKTDKAEEKE
ncbi:MAG: hypothetical protein GF401_05875 [Chitinivibrionales bacterium]|nr:hypothetical protein [Chitinivibrionales bacterium]